MWNARFSYNADPTFSRNNGKNREEKEGRLRVAGRLKHTSFRVNGATCVAFILGYSMGFEIDDSLGLGVTFTRVRGHHSCHAKPLTKTPLFPEYQLSGIENGGDRLIRARTRLGSTGDYPRFQRGVCLGG
jgi:hypothetical protein